MWALTQPVFDRLEHRARSAAVSGNIADLLVLLSLELHQAVSAPGPFRRFLQQEPDTAMRILLTPSGGVHERAVAAQRRLLLLACRRADVAAPAVVDDVDDVDDVAYLYVRIIESLLYADLIIGRHPDLAPGARGAGRPGRTHRIGAAAAGVTVAVGQPCTCTATHGALPPVTAPVAPERA